VQRDIVRAPLADGDLRQRHEGGSRPLAQRRLVSSHKYYKGSWTSGGGTSLGAPELAGFFAQVNSYLAFINLSGLGCRVDESFCNVLGQPG
jgi:hypothetical protein